MAEVKSRINNIQKMLLLLNYLNARKEATIDELCEKLGYEHKELKRVLKIINFCGLPDYTPYETFTVDITGKKVSISFADDFKKPVQFTEREAIALLIAAEIFKKTPLGTSSSLEKAIEKTEKVLPEDLHKAVKEIIRRVNLKLEPSVEDEALRIIKDSIEKQKTINIRYVSHGKREFTERKIDPLRVLYAGNKWYLQARDHRNGRVKSFILERIVEVKPTDERFEVTRKLLREAFVEPISPVWKSKVTWKVKLKFWGEAARLMSEILPEENVCWLDKNTIIASINAINLNWILTDYVFPYAESMTILEPEDLKNLAREEIGRMLNNYERGEIL